MALGSILSLTAYVLSHGEGAQLRPNEQMPLMKVLLCGLLCHLFGGPQETG